VRHREVEFEMTATLAGSLADAVVAYAHAAFPEGGSECAQVSREALLDTAKRCRDHRGGTLPLRKRQLAQLRAAVDWYFAEAPEASAEDGEALKALLAR
jgi:hypothetical protein